MYYRMLDWIDAFGKAWLTRRARRLFTRAFGPGRFTVDKADLLDRPPHRNHVQIHVDTAPDGIILLVFESFIEGNEVKFLTGKVLIGAGCTRCKRELSESWDTWLPRTHVDFRAGAQMLLCSSTAHVCDQTQQ